MTATRTDIHRLQELVRLHRQGVSPRAASRLLAMSPKTELKYRGALATAGLFSGKVDELPALDVLRAAVESAYPTAPPRRFEASTDPWLVLMVVGTRSVLHKPSEHAEANGVFRRPLRIRADLDERSHRLAFVTLHHHHASGASFQRASFSRATP